MKKVKVGVVKLLQGCETKLIQWWVSREILELMKLSVPIQLPVFASLLFVGWISTEDSSLYLDGSSLGTSFINITGSAIIIGGATASTTLSSQSYGYGNYKRVGIILQRGLLILLLTSVFIICLWLNTESVLLLLQQKPCVARFTNMYVRIMILALPPYLLYALLQQFLQPQNIVWPFIFVGLLTNVINVAFHALFIFGLKLGIQGAAGALVMSYTSQALILVLYIKIRKLHEKTWGGWSLECLKEWPQYLKLAFPGMLMIAAEWASFEISLLILGSIDETDQAVSGILISYLSCVFMLPLGLGIAGSIRIGNELGAGNVKRAKRTVYVALMLIAINVISMLLLTIGLKDYIGKMYNADNLVQHKLKMMIYVTCFVVVADQYQTAISGILRGAGQQFKVAIINITSYYVFGLPVGISLAFATDMGALGMWIGLNVAMGLQAASVTLVLLSINWSKESLKARRRSAAEGDSSIDELKTDNVKIELREYSLLHNTENDTVEDEQDDGEKNMSEKEIEEVERIEEEDDSALDVDITDDASELLQATTTHEAKSSLVSGEDNAVTIRTDSATTWSISKLVNGSTSIKPMQIICQVSVVGVAVLCLIGSGITLATVHVPDQLINGNYSECTNDTASY